MKKIFFIILLLAIYSASFAQLGYTPSLKDCVGYWTLNSADALSTTIYDKSGKGNDGVSTNTPIFSTDQNGVFNQSMVFNGATDQIQVDMVSSGTYSFGIWLYGSGSGIEYIMDMRNTSGTGYLYWDYNNDLLVTSSGTIYINGVASTTITNGTWNYVCVTGITLDITAHMIIGVYYDEYLYRFTGNASDAMLFSSALTEDEVRQLYKAGRTTAKIKIDATSPYKTTPKLQKDLILDMPLAEPYTEAGADITITDIDGDGTDATATATGHGLNIGHMVYISGSTNYDGKHNVKTVADANTFTFDTTSSTTNESGTGKKLDDITKDRIPYSNDGTVEGATLKHDGLVNAGDGIAYINQDKAYGTWEFDFNKGADGNTVKIIFLANVNNGDNNYSIWFRNTENIQFRESDGTIHFDTAASYIAINTDYRIKITRSLAGVFTVYIKGGAFGWSSWTLVSTAGGSGTNPVTDNTYTTSNYLVADLDNGDTVSNLKIDGKRISLANAVQSTGTWTTTGPAYDFDGTNDYISIADTDDLSFGDGTSDEPFSISAWVNMEDATNYRFLSKGVYNTDGEWNLFIPGNNKLYFYIFDESEADAVRGRYYDYDMSSYENTWINIIATYNGVGGTNAANGIDIYINGQVVDNVSVEVGTYVAMENLTHDVWIGRYDTTYAEGQISGLKIFNRELSSGDVEYLYSKEKVNY